MANRPTITTRARKQVIQDEADAEVRYELAVHAAQVELDRAYDAAEAAANEAAAQETAEGAIETFGTKLKHFFFGEQA